MTPEQAVTFLAYMRDIDITLGSIMFLLLALILVVMFKNMGAKG